MSGVPNMPTRIGEQAIANLLERAEDAEAARDAALGALDRVVGIVSATGGYLSPEDQIALREARALLQEKGGR